MKFGHRNCQYKMNVINSIFCNVRYKDFVVIIGYFYYFLHICILLDMGEASMKNGHLKIFVFYLPNWS